ncbi:MAG: SAM-dependent methyltransferase [Firmicutes bacterium]|nr:SAM-dependent methyltransferase [Candidatus Fiminaster equi]
MQIPKRLEVIGELIHEGAYVADIGADHGLLERYIANHLKDYHILAVENKKGPMSALSAATKDLPNVILSLSDGIEAVNEQYDTIVLAGMGGDNIISILSKYPEKVKTVKNIIVDAHSFIPKVRRTLVDFGFDIEVEKLVLEAGVYYNVISFKRNSNQQNYSQDELEFGYNLSKDPLFKDYKNYLLNRYQKILNDMENSNCKNKKNKEILNEMRRFKSYE